jgi:hypothetical protein
MAEVTTPTRRYKIGKWIHFDCFPIGRSLYDFCKLVSISLHSFVPFCGFEAKKDPSRDPDFSLNIAKLDCSSSKHHVTTHFSLLPAPDDIHLLAIGVDNAELKQESKRDIVFEADYGNPLIRAFFVFGSDFPFS